MAGGHMGKVLFVDLSSGQITEESPDEQLYNDFLGGYGLGARIVYSRQKPKVDALGPDNILGLSAGTLTGTPAVVASRYTAVGKSPLTGTWGDANSGGFFGPALKRSGYDAVFFSGISDKPVYLLIDEGKAELRDAAGLWGLDTVEMEDKLKAELGTGICVAGVGPAGEKKSLIAAIMNDKYRAAGRSGLGAVMGSKNLKAVVARGTKEIPVHDIEKARELRKRVIGAAKEHIVFNLFSNLGTCGITAGSSMSGDAPIKNWAGVGSVDFPNASAISDANVVKYISKKFACWQCPIACGGDGKVESGPYAGEGHKPEYETLGSFGTMCLNDNVESIFKANDICNRMGLDTISAGCTIAFAIECYENGIITKKDTDGIELTWGNHEAIVAMTDKLAKREGFGDVLADGVKVAAEKIGKGADQYAMHVHGQELPMHDPRLNPGYGTTYQIDATPGRHTQGGTAGAESGFPVQGLYDQPVERYEYSGKGEAQMIHSNFQHIVNVTGLCMFGAMTTGAEPIVEFMSVITGHDYTMQELLLIGERVANVRMAFNVREGVYSPQFKVPARILGSPPLEEGPLKSVTIDLETQVKEYCQAMGWDPATGTPSKEKLEALGLDDIAKDLHCSALL